MRFGINFVNGGELADPDAATELAVLADELGFSTLWAADHVVIPVGYESRYPAAPSGDAPFGHDTAFNEALVHLAFLASVTRRIRLATGVMIIAQRNALEVAKSVATLDHLSQGRAILGVGTGWLREEFDALGADFDQRIARTEESIEVLRRLWRAPGAEFHGRHFDFGPVTCNPRPCNGGVPIVVGGYALATARRAGRIGNGHYPGPASVSDVERYRAEIERTAIDHGRDPAAIESIVAAPYDRPLDVDLCARYAAAGVAEIIITVPLTATGGGAVGDSMRRVLETFHADVIDPLGAG